MSKNGKLKKAKKVEKRRLQMQEALECLPLKEAAGSDPLPSTLLTENDDFHPAPPVRKKPKQCTFPPCGRYLDPSCLVCPYCGTALPD
ncbi:hypothetical protein M1B72_14465 [Geomonas paludis]|uniref:Uncharacterized protein n=1 Tax=Geomonas paludis TaxID=2740185 RepID=A0A6V8MY63_9BACT|nr:hypothetical protein [Geomonas paludis]UPU34645.1 hypothetical protein M1B72_14465 [Geomonas paludis]GFO65020.1 hypothetical protein GMPD_29390 [Geomonas paludis]